MAEHAFQEVMKQAQRMCCYPEYCDCCVGCPLISEQICGCVPQDWTDEQIAVFERVVMDWAQEHPEPQYPTWGEFLSEKMVSDMMDGRLHGANTLTTYIQRTPIPADIAEKLGIEPIKEDEG